MKSEPSRSSRGAPIDKILIANRGEIAVRIARACRELGVASVAVYSDADADAMHVRHADEAVRLGPPAAGESYLNIERTLDAADRTGAQAIHPGYGFLAENAKFARAVRDAGLLFIGPPPEAIEAMGDKSEARVRMQRAGVPVVPGYQGEVQGDEALMEAAAEIGFPILVKAAAGGGGKGMRTAESSEALPEALAAARREAKHAFGDDRLIMEKYLPNARHIEFQILADQDGETIHLNERECSIQRRHQKIIEETPSPLLDSELRAEMGAAAVAAAEAVGYTNAGTVEFIVDPDSRSFYFLEMNTRIQVEHPITEFVTGVDLVQWQIKIAAGYSIERLQSRIIDLHAPHGHAIECRLYAEDPANQFLPDSGLVLRFAPPAGPGIRVDSGIAAGDRISTHYDPMIAKIVVHAEDRPTAIQRMQMALQETVLLGLTNNLQFLQDVLAHPNFQEGTATTRFVERAFSNWQPTISEPPLEVLIAAAVIEQQSGIGLQIYARDSVDPYSPWDSLGDFRIGGRS